MSIHKDVCWIGFFPGSRPVETRGSCTSYEDERLPVPIHLSFFLFFNILLSFPPPTSAPCFPAAGLLGDKDDAILFFQACMI